MVEREVPAAADTQPSPAPQEGVIVPSVESVASETTPQEPSVEAPQGTSPSRWQEIQNKPVSEWNLTPEELSSPEFVDTLEQMRKERLMQQDYTRKTQELAELKKQLWDPSAKQFSDQDVLTLLNNPSFVNVAQQLINQQSEQQLDTTTMTEQERHIYEQQQKLQQQATQMQQALQAQQQYTYQQQLAAEVKTLDGKYSGAVTPLLDKIQAVRVGAANPQSPLSVEGAFKALNYDEAVKKAYEAGKTEGMGIKQRKLTNQPINDGLPLAHGQEEPVTDYNKITEMLKAQARQRRAG